MQPIHLIGVPLDLGGNRRGTDMGPSAFRIAGIGEQLARLGRTVVDKGDIVTPIPELKGPGDVRKRYVKDIARVCQKLYQTSLASLHEGALPIVLGGDHSLGAGSVAAAAAFQRTRGESLGLVWVDAHGDMNRPDTSESGNVHGMPLAALLGPEPAELARIGGDEPSVLARNTVLVGIRNLDEIEKQLVRASGSVAANYIEANEAISRKDFALRIKYCRKEAKESRLFLSLLDTADAKSLEEERATLIQDRRT